MSPRSLLFTSDREMAQRLAQVLRELGLGVEFCFEIFDGIKKLTSHSFDVIVADWDDGVEAGFLLKTARELRANAGAFLIVVAESDGAAVAEQSGAHLLLTKPILPGYAKYALLTSELSTRMQKWAADPKPSPIATPQPAMLERRPRQQPQTGTLETILRRSGTAPTPERKLAQPPRIPAAPLPSVTLQASVAEQPVPFTNHPAAYHQGRNRQRVRQFLWGAALGVALISGGYVFSRPGLTIPTVSAAAVSSNLLPPLRASDQDDAKYGAVKEPSIRRATYDPDSSKGVKVMAAHQATTSPVERATEEPQGSNTTEETVSLISGTAGPLIPDSLKTAIDGTPAHDSGAKTGAPLLGAVEPVTLNEDLSQEMLTTKVQPDYPESAVRAGLQGSVVLQAWIRKDGTVRELKLIRGPWLLAKAACDAVKQWRYRPYLMNGRLVEAQTYVTINFRLP